MTNNINGYFGKSEDTVEVLGNWEDQKLIFAVREPFSNKNRVWNN